jgi:hypothetical protein
MNPLRTLENMIAGLVEGTFGRVFKAEVRPMELAHKLAREMDENKTASVSRVYAPNEYSVWLSPRDRARYEGVEHEVIDELCAYLLEHARAESLALASRPRIAFHTDDALQLGEFGIEARTTRSREEQEQEAHEVESPPSLPAGRPVATAAPPRPAPEEAGNTMIFSNSERVGEAVAGVGGRRRPKALLVVSGRRLLVPPRGATIGRSRDCDIVLDDAGVSRRHAELRPESATTWAIEDLGSTNGVRVNGLAVAGAHELRTGDRIGMGSTEMTFEVAP